MSPKLVKQLKIDEKLKVLEASAEASKALPAHKMTV